MGRLWTDEMQADLERWQASEGAPSPVDFLIIEPGFRDFVRGFANYVIEAIRYRILGGTESPWTLRQEIGFANVDYYQLGSARVAEVEDWLEEELDSFEDVECYRA